MSEAKGIGPYSVGYAQPPKNTQFQKGSSGNPKGRPKGTQNIATLLARILEESVEITVDGQPRTVTRREAVLREFVDRAPNDSSLLRQLIALDGLAAQQSGVEIVVTFDDPVPPRRILPSPTGDDRS
jgi:hypothetical protein